MLKRGIALLTGILIIYAALVATHQGEFWPFSIYPMFSQGGQPWTYTLVRKLTANPKDISWDNKPRSNLPGKALALHKIKIDSSSLSAYLAEGRQWNNGQIKKLRTYFQSKLDQSSFLIFKVQGQIMNRTNSSVAVTYTPYILIRKDTTLFNPQIFDSPTKQSGL